MASGNSQKNLASPDVRRETFKTYTKDYPDITQLVEAGFYYLDVGDECQCYLCAVRLFNWEINDDPMNEHRKYRPDCEIFNLKDTPEKSVSTPHVPSHHSSKLAPAVNPENFYTPQPGTVIPDSSKLPNNYKTEHTVVETDHSICMMHSPPEVPRDNPPLLHNSFPYSHPPPRMENRPPPPDLHPLPSRVLHQYSVNTLPYSTVYRPQTYPQVPPPHFNHYPPTAATTTFMPRYSSNSPHFAAPPSPISGPYGGPIHFDPRFNYSHRV